MPMIVADCVIEVPSLLGSYAPFGLKRSEFIGVALRHINEGDIAFVEHPEYAQSGCIFSDAVIDLAVEILQQLPGEFESDFDHIEARLVNEDCSMMLQLQFKD